MLCYSTSIYVLILFSVMSTLFIFDFYSISSVISSMFLSSFVVLSLVLGILSLGGIPPFLGFFPKWMVIQSFSSVSLLLPLILILGSILNLIYYLNFLFITSVYSTTPKWNSSISCFQMPSWPILVSSLSLLMWPIFLL